MEENKVDKLALQLATSMILIRCSNLCENDSLEQGVLLAMSALIVSEDWIKVSALRHIGSLLREDMQERGEFDENTQKAYQTFTKTLEDYKEKL